MQRKGKLANLHERRATNGMHLTFAVSVRVRNLKKFGARSDYEHLNELWQHQYQSDSAVDSLLFLKERATLAEGSNLHDATLT